MHHERMRGQRPSASQGERLSRQKKRVSCSLRYVRWYERKKRRSRLLWSPWIVICHRKKANCAVLSHEDVIKERRIPTEYFANLCIARIPFDQIRNLKRVWKVGLFVSSMTLRTKQSLSQYYKHLDFLKFCKIMKSTLTA